MSRSSMLAYLHNCLSSNGLCRIIRTIMFIPTYAIYSFLIIYFPEAQVSLLPWQSLIEAFALGNFFLLLCELISPHEDQRSLFFAALELPKKRGGKQNTANPLVWYRRKWIAIFQFPPVAILVGIITDVTESLGKYCDGNYNPKFANLWITIITNVSLTFALTAILYFYQALKTHLASSRPLSKLAAFKGIIFFNFLTVIIFLILDSTGVLHPTATLTYADTKVGIPTLISSLIMIPFSIFFHYAYTYRPYIIDPSKPFEDGAHAGKLGSFRPSYQGGPLGVRAYLYALNPSETFSAIFFAATLFSKEASKRAATYGSDRFAGREPLRSAESSQGISLAPSNSNSNSNPNSNGEYHQPSYALPNPTINEPAPGYGNNNVGYENHGYAGGYASQSLGGHGHGHSRSPSREQFLPPGGSPLQRPRGDSDFEPESYGPLNDRGRY